MFKTPNSAMEKALSSIYLDPCQAVSCGGLDAVYRAVNDKGKSKIFRKTKTLTRKGFNRIVQAVVYLVLQKCRLFLVIVFHC